MESDYRYYTRRATEENLRARNAVTAAARDRHLDLATLFAKRAEQRSIQNVVARIKDFSHRPHVLIAANGVEEAAHS